MFKAAAGGNAHPFTDALEVIAVLTAGTAEWLVNPFTPLLKVIVILSDLRKGLADLAAGIVQLGGVLALACVAGVVLAVVLLLVTVVAVVYACRRRGIARYRA